jgi:acetyltransferase-like isoleucine patch superfamily enzyme
VEDEAFLSPQLMTENINHKGEEVGGAKVGKGVFIGTNVTLAAGIKICEKAVIGSKANVRKNITTPDIYIGNPARRLQK